MNNDINIIIKTYVRTVLEYCSSVWSPSILPDQTLIESVQRSFSNDVFRKLHLLSMYHESQFTYMNLLKLTFRQSITEVLELFQICKGFSIYNHINVLLCVH